MIVLFGKLQREGLLKENGILLDLGCGDGRISEPFFKYGYETILVDKDNKILSEAKNNFKKIKDGGFKTIISSVEDFNLDNSFDGIIMSNVLPFQKNKDRTEIIVKSAFDKLNKGGFLYFTLFGINDEWAQERADTMDFHTKDEALCFISKEPYFISEDYGRGSTMNGDIKTWHIFHLLYIKL